MDKYKSYLQAQMSLFRQRSSVSLVLHACPQSGAISGANMPEKICSLSSMGRTPFFQSHGSGLQIVVIQAHVPPVLCGHELLHILPLAPEQEEHTSMTPL